MLLFVVPLSAAFVLLYIVLVVLVVFPYKQVVFPFVPNKSGGRGIKQKIQVEKINLDFEAVGIPGLEPGMTGPESVVLPLHHIPLFLATVIA